MKPYIYLFMVIVLMLYTHVATKLGVSKLPANVSSIRDFLFFALKAASQPWIISAVFATAIAVGFWMLTLQHLDLSRSYPAMACLFVLLPIVSRLFLGEPLSGGKIIGGFIIIFGVFVSIRY